MLFRSYDLGSRVEELGQLNGFVARIPHGLKRHVQAVELPHKAGFLVLLGLVGTPQSQQVRTLVDETDMGELKPGLTTSVSVEAYPDRTFTGTVDKIEPQAVVEQNVTMFPVIVSLDNRAGLLKPGMNAEVEIEIRAQIERALSRRWEGEVLERNAARFSPERFRSHFRDVVLAALRDGRRGE